METATNTKDAHSDKSFLGTEAIGKLMVRLSIPTVLGQLINLTYNIVDRIFIGHIAGIGTDTLTAVGVCFPIITLITAFCAFVGAGGAPLASIALGRNDTHRAEKIFHNSIKLLFMFACALLLIILPARDKILLLFGASASTLSYASSYLGIYLLGTFFVMAYLGLNPFVIAQGDSKRALVAIATGAILNIVLDPIFIFVFDLGVQGAACTDVIAQFVSAAITLSYFHSPRTVLHIRRKLEPLDPTLIKKILSLGSGPFCMQATESLVAIVLNTSLQIYGGDIYVGAFTIMQSMMQVLTVPAQGFSQGAQPVISYSYGAQLFDRVRAACKRLMTITVLFELIGALLIIAFPAAVARIFTNDTQLINLVGQVAPFFFAGMCVFGIQVATQIIFMSLGQSILSLTIALSRKLILLIPLALILPHFLGVRGIYFAEPISDVLAVTLSACLLCANFTKILNAKTLDKVS